MSVNNTLKIKDTIRIKTEMLMVYLEVRQETLIQVKQGGGEEEVDRVSCATIDRLAIQPQCTGHIVQRETFLKSGQINVD